MRKNIIRVLPVKLTILVIASLLGGLFVVSNTNRFLKTSDYFKVKDIFFKNNETIDLSYLKGRNIFTLDLQKESQYLSGDFPAYQKIRLVRVLPDRIFVDFIKRKPLAYVKLYRYFAVDEEGLFFADTGKLEEESLPVIVGLETKIFGPKLSRTYRIKELTFALNIIKTCAANPILKDYRIKRLNVAHLNQVSFFMMLDKEQDLEVKLDEANFKDKLEVLASIVNQSRRSLSDLEYVDLRFKESVIKLKNVQ